MKRSIFEMTSNAIDLFAINELLTQWFNDDAHERYYSIALLQMISLNTSLFHRYLRELNNEYAQTAGIFSSLLRVANLMLHFITIDRTEQLYLNIMPVFYSNLINLPLEYAVDSDCNLNPTVLATAFGLPVGFTHTRHQTCSERDENYYSYVTGFTGEQIWTREILTYENDCAYLGFWLGNFKNRFSEEIFYGFTGLSAGTSDDMDALVNDFYWYSRSYDQIGTDFDMERSYDPYILSLGRYGQTVTSALAGFLFETQYKVTSGSITDDLKASEQVEEMIKAGTDIDERFSWSNGDTPLHYAVQNNLPNIAKVLLDNGADPLVLNLSAQYAYQLGSDTALQNQIKEYAREYWDYDGLP